jgi:hypothetical protein
MCLFQQWVGNVVINKEEPKKKEEKLVKEKNKS